MTKSTLALKLNCFPMNTCSDIDKAIDLLNTEITKNTEKSIPKKEPFLFRYSFSQEIDNLKRYWNYFREQLRETGDVAYKSLMNQASNLIKEKSLILNKKKLDDKIASLTTEDNTLFEFSRTLKNTGSRCG